MAVENRFSSECPFCHEWPPCDCPPGHALIRNAEMVLWARLLRSNGVALLAALRRFADRDGVCWPSGDALVKSSGLCRSVLFKTIELAVAYGLLAREPMTTKRTKAGRPPNKYTLPPFSS